MSELLQLDGSDIIIGVPVEDVDGNLVSGETVKFNLQRRSDDKWWNGSAWVTGSEPSLLTAAEVGSTGVYEYTLSGGYDGTSPNYLLHVNSSVIILKNVYWRATIVASDAAVASIASDVWDEILTGATHNIATSAGKRLRQLADADVLHDGTVQAPYTVNTLVLEAVADANNDYYQECFAVIVDGTGKGQGRHIQSYVGADRLCNVKGDWIVTPDATSKYEVKLFSLVHTHEVDELGTQAKADVNAEVDQSLIDYDSGKGVAKDDTVSKEATAAKDATVAKEAIATTNKNSIITEVDAVKVDTAAIKVQSDKMNFTGNNIHSIPKAKDAAVGLSTQEKADVLVEAKKPIFTETNPEIVDMSDVLVTPTLSQATMLHYMDRRNGGHGESDLNEIQNDNGDAVLAEDISTTGTVVTATKLRNP